jgi:hypothetical protein
MAQRLHSTHSMYGRGMIDSETCRKLDRLARRHGASFVNVVVPGRGWVHWFATADRSRPLGLEDTANMYERASAEGFVLP